MAARFRRRRAVVGVMATVVLVAGIIGTTAPPASSAAGTILVAHSAKVMTVFAGSTAPGAPIVQSTPNGAANQSWRVVQLSVVNGYSLVLIQSVATGQVLDVASAATQPGAAVVQAPWTGAASQWWMVYPFGDTGFELLFNINSGKAVDAAGASFTDGTPIIQWDWNGGLNQIWSIPALETLPPPATTTTAAPVSTTTTEPDVTTTTEPDVTTTTEPDSTTTTEPDVTTTSIDLPTTTTISDVTDPLGSIGALVGDLLSSVGEALNPLSGQ